MNREKRRLGILFETNKSFNAKPDLYDTWIAIQSKLNGRSFVQQEEYVDALRSSSDLFHRVVLNLNFEKDHVEVVYQSVNEVLDRFDLIMSSYASRRQLIADYPSLNYSKFKDRIDALVVWTKSVNYIEEMKQRYDTLCGYSVVYERIGPQTTSMTENSWSSKGSWPLGENSWPFLVDESIAQVLLSLYGFGGTFKLKWVSEIDSLAGKLKKSLKELSSAVGELGLPPLLQKLDSISAVPSLLVATMLHVQSKFVKQTLKKSASEKYEMLKLLRPSVEIIVQISQESLHLTRAEIFHTSFSQWLGFLLDLFEGIALDFSSESCKHLFKNRGDTLEQWKALLRATQVLEGRPSEYEYRMLGFSSVIADAAQELVKEQKFEGWKRCKDPLCHMLDCTILYQNGTFFVFPIDSFEFCAFEYSIIENVDLGDYMLYVPFRKDLVLQLDILQDLLEQALEEPNSLNRKKPRLDGLYYLILSKQRPKNIGKETGGFKYSLPKLLLDKLQIVVQRNDNLCILTRFGSIDACLRHLKGTFGNESLPSNVIDSFQLYFDINMNSRVDDFQVKLHDFASEVAVEALTLWDYEMLEGVLFFEIDVLHYIYPFKRCEKEQFLYCKIIELAVRMLDVAKVHGQLQRLKALEYLHSLTAQDKIMEISSEIYQNMLSSVSSTFTEFIPEMDVHGCSSRMEIRKIDDESTSLLGFSKEISLLHTNPSDIVSATAVSSASLSSTAVSTSPEIGIGDTSPIDMTNIHRQDIIVPDARSTTRLHAIEELEEKILQKSLKQLGKVMNIQSEYEKQVSSIATCSSQMSIKWQIGKLIGSGTEGSVYTGINLENGEIMAVKEFKFKGLDSLSKIKKILVQEVAVFTMIKHENLVDYFGSQVYRDKIFVFMEYCPFSLDKVLSQQRLNETQVKCCTRMILGGVSYLHEQQIVHRDIKPSNILITYRGVLKIADFASSNFASLASAITNQATFIGTCYYIAPEVVTASRLTKLGSQDVWSIGCCVYEMVTGKPPWSDMTNEWAILYKIGSSVENPIQNPNEFSVDCLDFLMNCFRKDLAIRPSCAELLSHTFSACSAFKMSETREFFIKLLA